MDTFLFILFFVFIGYWLGPKFGSGRKREIIIIKDDDPVPQWSAKDMEKIFEAFEAIKKELDTNVQIEDTVDEILTEMTSTEDINNATKALKKLGYKDREIKNAINQITPGKSTPADIVISALSVLNA
jgi:Holliday junction resolvasome RuvABC DNA-binding subunit